MKYLSHVALNGLNGHIVLGVLEDMGNAMRVQGREMIHNTIKNQFLGSLLFIDLDSIPR